MSVAGIDIGTTGCKCTVFSDSGTWISEAYEEYHFAPEVGERELDAAAVWDAVCSVIRRSAQKDAGIRAVAAASMGEAAVCLDEHDVPLNHPILYFDPRGEEENRELTARVGAERLYEITRMEPSKIYTVPKMMWLERHHPGFFRKAAHLLLMEDFIVYMLSGTAQIDRTLATRTYAFDMQKLDWSDEILEAAGIPRSLMPRVVPTGTAAGKIRPALAAELGLPGDTLIVSGAHDQPAAMLGTGCLREGLAADSTGTNECITAFIDAGLHPDYLLQREVPYVPSLYENTYSSGIFCFTGGAMLKWFRDKIAPDEAERAKQNGMSAYDYFNSRVQDRPSGLIVLPYFLGKGAPGMDPDAKGTILGLTPETNVFEIYRALMEGVSFEMRTGLEYWKSMGIELTELRATGGGARSPLWLQIKADIFGIPVSTMKAEEGGALACAMLAAAAAGIYGSVEEAAKAFIRTDKTYLPDRERQAEYNEWYERYRVLEKRLSGAFDRNWGRSGSGGKR